MPLAQRAKYTGIALKKAYRLEELVNEFFEITRFNLSSVQLERGRLNLSRMLLQMADEFFPVLLERGLRCETQIEPDILVTADADKLARVFDNLRAMRQPMPIPIRPSVSKPNAGQRDRAQYWP